MSGSTTPKKTVRFALEVAEPTESPGQIVPPIQDANKKVVRFVTADEIVLNKPTPALPQEQNTPAASPSTLLDTDITLATPSDSTPFDFSNVSQSSSSTLTGHSTATTLSPHDILTWSETITASALPGLSLPTTVPAAPPRGSYTVRNCLAPVSQQRLGVHGHGRERLSRQGDGS
jgi:hypothetical protein